MGTWLMDILAAEHELGIFEKVSDHNYQNHGLHNYNLSESYGQIIFSYRKEIGNVVITTILR